MTGQWTAGQDPAAPAGSSGNDDSGVGRVRLAARNLRARARAAASPPGHQPEAHPGRAADGTQNYQPPVPDHTVPDHTVPDHTVPDHTVPDHTGPDHTGPDPTGPDPTGPDPTGPDPTGPDPTVPDPTVPDPTGPAQSDPDPPAAGSHVPRLLQQAAAWCWRLLLVGLVIYLAFRLAGALRLVLLPFIAALLLTALLQPLTARLRRVGMPNLAATWCTFIAASAVIAGVITLTANRVSADYPTLATEVTHTATQVQKALAGPPFHLHVPRLQRLTNELLHYLSQHKGLIAGTVLTGGKIAIELLTGLILVLFITFFLLKDGRRIWTWLISGMRTEGRRRAGNAGTAAWQALTNYIRGTTAVAAIHAVFIGLALWLLGVPLLVPLIILVFLAAYIPLVGILVVGALAILITLGTKGWLAAVILLAVFLVENQLESHLLQPLVVGRIVRLHPLAIILVLAVGGIIAGIPGAIVAVPATAVITHAWPYLRGRESASAGDGPDQ